MTSTSGAGVDPAPLFDLVTGFPPDDAVDLTVPMPLSLALYMTMLESTGRARELAALKKIHIDRARATAAVIQAGIGDLVAGDVAASARLRVTHIVEDRVPGANGLRPHVHFFVGATTRDLVDRSQAPVDTEALAANAEASVLADHRAGLVTETARRCGLAWETTDVGPEVAEPRWLVASAARARAEEPPCRGPWPRRQILPGTPG